MIAASCFMTQVSVPFVRGRCVVPSTFIGDGYRSPHYTARIGGLLVRQIVWMSTFFLAVAASPAANLGPTPYLSFADSPLNGGAFTYFHQHHPSSPGAAPGHAPEGRFFRAPNAGGLQASQIPMGSRPDWEGDRLPLRRPAVPEPPAWLLAMAGLIGRCRGNLRGHGVP